MTNVDQHLDIDRMMSDNELILAYRDHITESAVQQLLSIAELKLVQTSDDKRLRKRVFHILVECLQNIVNHAVDGTDSAKSLLLIGRRKGEFFIVTGNRIDASNVARFEERLNEINSWDHSDIREIYSEKLGRSQYSAKGGAGLGLIDIYKRSGKKIKHSFRKIDEKTSFLSLHVSVGNVN